MTIAVAAKSVETSIFDSFSGKPAEVLSAQYEQYSKEAVVEAAAQVLNKEPTQAQRDFDRSEKFFRGGGGDLASSFSTKNKYLSGPNFKSNDRESVSYNSLDAAYSNVAHVFLLAKQAQAMLNAFYGSALKEPVESPKSILITALFEEPYIRNAVTELFGSSQISLMNPAHVCLAYDSKKVHAFLNKQATVRLSDSTARQTATALGTAVRNSMHFNSPPFDVNANSLNLVPQGSEGTSNYVLYYGDIPEAKITRFPMSTSSPEALKSWEANIRTLLANKSVTLQKIKGEPESLTQDELVSRVGDFGHMCELDPTMQQRFGVSNAKAFFAPEKALVKDKSPDYAGMKPGFINTSLMAAFKKTNDDCVRYDVQYILPSESTVRQHLRLMLNAEPDNNLVRFVANVNRMYVVHPRIVISQEYIRYVAQSLPARDSAGRITEPNFESLRSYFAAVICGSFNDGKYTAPKEAFSLQCSQLHEVARRRTQAGIPERAAATNQHNITVLPNAKAMFIPPQTASEGMLSAIDALLHKQAKIASKLCVPPESSLDEVERFVDSLPDEPIPTGSGPTIPGRDDAKVLFENFRATKTALASMQHIPLFVSQSMGFVAGFESGRVTTQSLEANKGLSEAAIQVTHNLHHSRDRLDSLFGSTATGSGRSTLGSAASLYMALSLYGEVPPLDVLIKRAFADWEQASGFKPNDLTCVDVYAGWIKGTTLNVSSSSGTNSPSFNCIEPSDVKHTKLREIATAMYREESALRSAEADAEKLEVLLRWAIAFEGGYMSPESEYIGHAETVLRFMRQMAACLICSNGSRYDSNLDTDKNYFVHAFLPGEKVQVAKEYASKLAHSKVTQSSVLALPSSVQKTTDTVDVDDAAEGSSTGMTLPPDVYDTSENPFAFFANLRVVSSSDSHVRNMKYLSRLSIVGTIANLVYSSLFDALNNQESVYYKPFFPMSVALTQRYSTENNAWESVVSNYTPLVSTTELTRVLMPLVYSKVIYAAKPELIKESLSKKLTSAGLSQDLIVRRKDSSDSVSLANLMQRVEIPNLNASTEIMRHQGVCLFNIAGSPKAQAGDLPNITMLAVDPGGGKTIMGESLAMMITEIMQKHGMKTKFIVFAPPRIVKNWYDDAQRFFGHRLNVYTLDTDTFNMMPADYIRAMVLDAPDNSIFVSSYSALVKSAAVSVALGSNTITERSTLSFMLSLGFTDVLFDESHQGKNEFSQTARAMASLCQQANVRAYLATGSVSAKSVVDAVNQLALVDRGVTQSALTFYNINVPAEEFKVAPNGVIDDKNMSAKSVRKLRYEMSQICNFQYVPSSNWAFSRPKIVYDVKVIKPAFKVLSPDDDYYKAMQWMISNGYLHETWEEIVQRDTYYMQTYDILLRAVLADDIKDSELNDAEKAARKKLGEELLDAVETTVAPKSENDDGADEAVVTEQISAQKLQRFSQFLNDPMHDLLDGKLVEMENKSDSSMPGKSALINLSTIRAPKIRMAAYMAVKHFTDDSGRQNVTPDNIRGRKLVFVADNIRTLFAFNRQLPAFLRERTRISISGKPQSNSGFHPNYEKELNEFDYRASQDARFDFESNDNVWILCAVESALSEGFNLQVANHMIRMDSPWASKAWKQTKARIDRPDTGKTFREEAFITWLVTDSTTEILRWGRAVSRITQSSVFDNANDPRFEKFETVPTFAINKDTLAQYSSFDSLRDVTVTTKKETVHADYVGLFAELQRTEQEVRADALKNDWEYARKHGLIETLKDKNGNLILKDGKPVERPRLMASPRTSNLNGSREVIITPTVHGASNDRLRAYGFKTYSLMQLLSSYNADLSSIKRPDETFGAHVYTTFGFGRVVDFGSTRGGGTPSTVIIRYPNGSSKIIPIGHVTVIENVLPDNPNLWMLNCMLDIPTYFSKKGADATHRIIYFGYDDGNVTVREVTSNADGHAVLGAELKPAEDFCEKGVTTFGNLRPRFDDGSARSDSGIRVSRVLNRDDVVLRNNKLYVVKPALMLEGARGRSAKLAVSVCEVSERGERGSENIVPYADFTRDFGFRMAWPEEYTNLLRAAAVRSFAKSTVSKCLQNFEPILMVDFVDGKPQARVDSDGDLVMRSLKPIEIMRLASGLSVDGFPEGTVLKAKRVNGVIELRYHFPNYKYDIKTNDPAMVLADTAARLIARCAALTFGKYTSEIFAEAFEGYAYPDAKEPALGSPQAAKRVGTYTELVTGKASKQSATSDNDAADKAAAVDTAAAKLNLVEFLLEDGVFALPVLTGNIKPVSGDGNQYKLTGLSMLKLHVADKVRGVAVEVKPNTVVSQTWAAKHDSGVYHDLSGFFKYTAFALIPVPRIYEDLVALAEGLAEECAELVPSETQEPDVYAFLTNPKSYLKNYMSPKDTSINTRARFMRGEVADAKRLVKLMNADLNLNRIIALPVASRSETGVRQVYLFVQNARAVSVATRLALELGVKARRVGALTPTVPTYSNVVKWPSVIGRVFGGTSVLGDTLDTFSRDLAEVAHGKLKTSHEQKR